MPIADENRKRWRVPILFFTGAFIGAVIFAAAHKHSGDELHDAVIPAAQQPSSQSEDRVTLSDAGAVNRPASANAAMQKPGPPNPESEKSAAESAEKAADVAAALAAKASSGTN